MRTIIDLPEDQLEALRTICEREGISRAEAIRRLIAQALAAPERRRELRAAILEQTHGSWKHMGIDTDAYLAEIRSEWEREWDQDRQ